jgi:hypothetical protein
MRKEYRMTSKLKLILAAAALAVAHIPAQAGIRGALPQAPAAEQPAAAAPAETPAAPAADISLSGEWVSEEVDAMSLTHAGSKVTGSYEYSDENGKHSGTLEGELQGARLKGRWSEQSAAGKYSGSVEWVVSSDGKSLSGQWRSDDGSEQGAWSAKKK